MNEKWEATKWVFWIIGIVLLLTVIGYALMPISKRVEREVLIQSHQYKEGMADRVATLQAVLAGIDNRLASGNIDEQMRTGLEAQAASQPVPVFNWSLERHLIIQLYQLRNQTAATHSVWRSDRGMVEGDCASIGFGIPYDTSLTNPLMATDEDPEGYDKAALTTIEQAEPNGVFASKNTAATWVMCAGDGGMIEPVYVETKVTVYPYPVSVDYNKNRVTKAGAASITIRAAK